MRAWTSLPRTIWIHLHVRAHACLGAAAHRIFKHDKGKMMTEAELESLLDRSQMMAEDAIKQEAKAKVSA